jgi:anti-sigma28 factor (negative regulator of flagellin synthesis)
MPASKKTASTKKASAKKAAAKKVPTAALTGDKLKLNFPLDASKVAAIKRCVAKGKLTVTVNKVDLSTGRIGEAWLYD